MIKVLFDVRELRALSTALGRFDAELQKEFLLGLKRAGDVVATQAKINVSSASTRIPGTVKVKRTGLVVKVSAGGARAPHAAPFEHKGLPGSFRHPLFGNREHWYDQPAAPFLSPALTTRMADVTQAILATVDTALVKAGWSAKQ